MTVHQVELQQVTPTPWRNGGGVTRDLLVWPQAEGWSVRVSVATIDRSGPFSAFPGTTRWFNVLSGDGVTLGFATSQRTLRMGDPPLCFDGADAPTCALLGAATQDLNLMAPTGAGLLNMQCATHGSSLQGTLLWRGLYVAAPATLLVDGQTQVAPAQTLLWSSTDQACRWQFRGDAPAWWLSLQTSAANEQRMSDQ